jgi:Superinfection immunity protein
MPSSLGLLIPVFAVLAALVYFVPSFVAVSRCHQNTSAILILNIFLGWSFVGWVIALVWSFTEVKRREPSGGPRVFSDPRRGVWIVLAIASAFVFIILGTLIMLSSTEPAPFIYELF